MRSSLVLSSPFAFAFPFALALLVSTPACVPPPPNIAAVPPSGMSLRVHIFGAEATDVHDAFVAANKNTPKFHVVNDGGDGDVLLGLENDSPMCVPPTGLCSFKIGYRVRNNSGEAVTSGTTTVTAQSDKCASLCSVAINNVVVNVVQEAATALGGPAPTAPPAEDPKKAHGAAAKAPPPICSVAAGPRLPSGEAESRAAQVEVLKRIGVLDQVEYDCLRKAYLSRL
jgi:hypothetical protein